MRIRCYLLAVIFAFIFHNSLACAQSQSNMNNLAYKTYEKTDTELNQVYSLVLKRYQNDKKFISKLKVSESYWIKFRDAQFDAIFPEDDKYQNYGSNFPICKYQYLNELTQQRIVQLKKWLNGSCESGLCSETIPEKQCSKKK